LTKYFLMLTKTDMKTGDVLGPPESFSQKCPGGSTFELVSAAPPIGPRGNVVVVQQPPEKNCLSECEHQIARYTYFRTNTRIKVCPFTLADIERRQILDQMKVPAGRQSKIGAHGQSPDERKNS
jgi:hypothetical protein